MHVEVQRRCPAISAVAPLCCHAARPREKKSEGFERNGAMERFRSKMVRNVIWNSDVVAENWYEADGRFFQEALAPLSLISIAATGCVRDSWYSGAACPGQREGVVSLGSRNSARASRMMSRSAMLGAQRAT